MPLLRYHASGLQYILCLIRLQVLLAIFRSQSLGRRRYVSIDDMVADAWISPTTVELKLPVAIATIRNKKAAGFQIVTRGLTTDNNE